MAHLDGPIVTHDDSKGPLTYGIELEFLVPGLKAERLDQYPDDPRPLFRIEDFGEGEYHEKFNEFILPSLQEVEDITVREELQDKFIPPHDNVPEYHVWRLTNETSARFESDFRDLSNYEWLGKEVTSEVFKADDPTYPQKIIGVCRAIRSHRVHLNHTTAVHVHVGRGNDGFTLTTVKKFASLLWLVDCQLLSLHHPSRQNNQYCPLLKSMSQLGTTFGACQYWSGDAERLGLEEMGEYFPTGLPHTLSSQLRRIWDSVDLEELAYLMGNQSDPKATNPMRSAKRGTVGFRRFLPAGKTGGNINTLEFRQMAGCLDPEPIISWIKICVAMVDFARLSDAATFRGLVCKILAQGERYTAQDLLQDLGMESEVAYYNNKMAGYMEGSARGLELYEGASHNLFLHSI